MRTVLVALSLLTLALASAPVAAAEPCEVPGCNVAGAAVCLVNEVAAGDFNYKTDVQACLTQTA